MKKVLVTGGASFIGSHLVEALLARNCEVRVVDNLSSGKLSNIVKLPIERIIGDLHNDMLLNKVVKGADTVFHLAAEHGGRGYVDTHQVACSRNFALDSKIFMACANAGVEKVVFASSGCVYPNYLQKNPKKILYLSEDMVGPPYDADNIYGWAKLMAEKTLQAYADKEIMKTVNCRYFTVYGPRGKEDHAIMAMIARAFIQQNPYEIWGDGTQIRNWTYVTDIIEGTIKAAEIIDDGSAVNLGTMERTSVKQAAKYILETMDYEPRWGIKYLKDMPTGPLNRVADNSFAEKLLDWKPKVEFKKGVKKTIRWYKRTHDIDTVKRELEGKLLER